MIWLFGITILGLALWLILFPFFEKHTRGWIDSRLPFLNQRQHLREEKRKLVTALKELDFDFETGKLSADDYKQLREKYEGKAIAVMKEQDVLEAKWKEAERRIPLKTQKEETSVEPQKEKPVESTDASNCPNCQAKTQATDRFCPQCGTSLNAFCPECGNAVHSNDRFCNKCGHALQGETK